MSFTFVWLFVDQNPNQPYNRGMTNKYTLITKTGKVMVFNVKAAAEIFHQAYGGVLYDAQDLAWKRLQEKFEQNPEMMNVLKRLKEK